MGHITILLKPRPTHKKHGTNWLPRGNAYGPFHPAHSPPGDATDAHEITVSNTLIAQWAEFHTIIRPLLVLPPALDSAPMRTLYAGWHAHHAPRLDRLGSFFAVLYARIVELHTAAGLHAGGLRVAQLSARLFATDLSPLSESILELKITVNMLQETVDSMLSATKYKADLDERCSIWDKAFGRGSFLIDNIQSTLMLGAHYINPLAMESSSSSSSSARSEKSDGTDPSDVVSSVTIPDDADDLHLGLVRRHVHRRPSS